MHRAWLVLAAVPAGLLAAYSRLGGDYANLVCHLQAPRCDEASVPINALVGGHLATFVHEQPLMGPVSLVLRAPFVAVADRVAADVTWHYRAGVFACLVVSVLVAVMLVRESRARDHSRLQTAAIAVLFVINPAVRSALDLGHPEELLAAAAVVGSALFALHGRTTAAAVTLGLAVATKPWAALVVPAIVLALPADARRRGAAVAGLVALLCYLPLIAGDPGRFHTIVRTAGSLGSHPGEATAPEAWFFATHTGTFSLVTAVRGDSLVFQRHTGYALSPGTAHAAHALALLVALALTFAWWRWGARRGPESLFLLLAGILLARCALDPGNHLYYHVSAIAALLGYEAVRPHARLPWLAGTFIATLWFLSRVNSSLHTDTAFAVVYLSWAVAAFAAIGLVAIRARRRLPEPA